MKKLLLFLVLLLSFGGKAYSYNKTYAVIIGVTDYLDDDLDLQFPAKDAIFFKSFLMSKEGGSVPSENIVLLLDSQANKKNIIEKSKALFAKAKKNDRVFFYFSGHGGKGFFAPYDITYYGDNMLTYNEVKEIFRCAKCNTKLLFADACFSGGIKGNRGTSSTTQNSDKKQQIAIMLSSQYDEYSNEIIGGGIDQGLFTYYIIEGLSGKANRDNSKYITIEELYTYVYKKVAAKAAMLNPPAEQHPQLFGNFDLRLIVGKVL